MFFEREEYIEKMQVLLDEISELVYEVIPARTIVETYDQLVNIKERLERGGDEWGLRGEVEDS